MQQFQLLNQQQQPFIQSGYGAMGKLNTLLGIGGRRPVSPGAPPPGLTVNNGPSGPGVRIPQRIPQYMGNHMISSPKSNPRLAQLLALRAQNGDTEAARIAGMM